MSINVNLIRESFDAIKPHALEVVDHFYGELFSRYPQAKPLFKGVNMKKQKQALANSLAHCVEFIEEPDHLSDYLFKMGGRHSSYGATEEHFGWVAEALLATFEYYFEDQWTSELKSAWVETYTFIAGEMKKGMDAAQKVEPIRAEPETPPSPELDEMVRSFAKDLYKKALEEEASDAALEAMAREKIRELLRKTLEKESREMMAQITGRSHKTAAA